MATNFRVTGPAIRVLRCFAMDVTAELSGADIMRSQNIASGTLYPVLHRFEHAGLLSSRWEAIDPAELGRPRRRLYRLTAEGINVSKELDYEFGTSGHRAPA